MDDMGFIHIYCGNGKGKTTTGMRKAILDTSSALTRI